MFISNAIVYSFKETPNYNLEEFAKSLEQDAFTPCLSQDLSKTGWVKPFGKFGGEIIEHQDRRILLCMKQQEKVLPAAAINEMVAEKVEEIELNESRRVNRKERLEIKDNIVSSLLPHAMVISRLTQAYIDMDAKLIVVNTSSFSKAETLLALLRKSLGTLPVVPAFANHNLGLTLTRWVKQRDLPNHFAFGQDMEMHACDDSAAKVKLQGHDLLCEEVSAHLDNGKEITKLGLEHQERIFFTLSSDGSIKRISYADELKAENDDIPNEDLATKLRADFVLAASLITELITELLEIFSENNASTEAGINFEASSDPLYKDAVEFVIETRRASVSAIQRKLRLGYNRSADLLETMVQQGLVSEPNHNGAREVLR